MAFAAHTIDSSPLQDDAEWNPTGIFYLPNCDLPFSDSVVKAYTAARGSGNVNSLGPLYGPLRVRSEGVTSNSKKAASWYSFSHQRINSANTLSLFKKRQLHSGATNYSKKIHPTEALTAKEVTMFTSHESPSMNTTTSTVQPNPEERQLHTKISYSSDDSLTSPRTNSGAPIWTPQLSQDCFVAHGSDHESTITHTPELSPTKTFESKTSSTSILQVIDETPTTNSRPKSRQPSLKTHIDRALLKIGVRSRLCSCAGKMDGEGDIPAELYHPSSEGPHVLSTEEEQFEYEAFRDSCDGDDLDPQLKDGEGDPRQYRISPEQFASFVEGVSLEPSYVDFDSIGSGKLTGSTEMGNADSAMTTANAKVDVTPISSISSRTSPSKLRIHVPEYVAQYDVTDGAELSPTYDLEEMPTMIMEPYPLNRHQQPNNLSMSVPMAPLQCSLAVLSNTETETFTQADVRDAIGVDLYDEAQLIYDRLESRIAEKENCVRNFVAESKRLVSRADELEKYNCLKAHMLNREKEMTAIEHQRRILALLSERLLALQEQNVELAQMQARSQDVVATGRERCGRAVAAATQAELDIQMERAKAHEYEFRAQYGIRDNFALKAICSHQAPLDVKASQYSMGEIAILNAYHAGKRDATNSFHALNERSNSEAYQAGIAWGLQHTQQYAYDAALAHVTVSQHSSPSSRRQISRR